MSKLDNTFDEIMREREAAFVCHRCGTCCKDFLATVPKHVDSDLSPDHLNSMELDAAMAYLDEHAEMQGVRCRWLIDNEDGTCSCGAYERRSEDCRNYPDLTVQTRCKVGEHVMSKRRGGAE